MKYSNHHLIVLGIALLTCFVGTACVRPQYENETTNKDTTPITNNADNITPDHDNGRGVQIALGTSFEKEYFAIETGSSIWALAQGTEGYMLQERTVQHIEPYENEIHGQTEYNFTTVPDTAPAAFYFRGISLRPGKVDMILHDTEEKYTLINEFQTAMHHRTFSPYYQFTYAGHFYKLVIDTDTVRPGSGFALVLNRDGRRQALFSESGDAIAGIYWIGDIDRDGLADFMLFSSSHYAGRNTRLFLSSRAQGEEIVRQVATLENSD